jgi:ribonuclease BN (tRNA processing enzyme)
VDDRLAVDAGAIATALTLDEQIAVDDVLLTHSHLDHVRDLPLMLINGNRTERPLRVMHHTIDTAGWLVEGPDGAVFLAGDTDDEDCLAPVVAATGDRLKAVLLESSFPEDQAEFAKMTGHLTPSGLGRAARALPPDVPLFVTHMKPGYEEIISSEIRAIGNPSLRPALPGEVIEI